MNVFKFAYCTPYAVVLMLWMVAGWWCCRAAPIQAVWSLKVKGWPSGQKLWRMMAQLVTVYSSCSKASRLRDSATWCLAVVPEGGATSLSSVVCNCLCLQVVKDRIGIASRWQYGRGTGLCNLHKFGVWDAWNHFAALRRPLFWRLRCSKKPSIACWLGICTKGARCRA